ncbi:MAG TPA: ABC transporter ATP-binding protein [Gaiellaceae bacterium]
MDPAPDIRLSGLVKRYGDLAAVDGIDLDVRRGEFFTLLGPSGSGKTTTLRLIAGFERPDAGSVELAGTDVSAHPPFARDVNTVFQDYALFPHMSVADNVAYGLRIRKVPRPERTSRVAEALEMVRLPELGGRRPAQLSGGQRQRVALARAIVNRPQVLLLDEPLGALDLKLRQEMQVELKRIQQDVGITFVYVTHDQEEALTMSDRMAVMNGGHVEQAGSPREVYEEPRTSFVAGFLGVSNLLDAEAGPDGGACALRIGGRTFRAEQGATEARGEVKAMIRPERIELEPHGASGDNRLPGLVERAVFLGGSHEVHVRIVGGEVLKATVSNTGRPLAFALEEGASVTMHLPSSGLRVLEPSQEPEPEPESAAEAAERPDATAPSM